MWIGVPCFPFLSRLPLCPFFSFPFFSRPYFCHSFFFLFLFCLRNKKEHQPKLNLVHCMRSSGNNCNYFPQNHLTKLVAHLCLVWVIGGKGWATPLDSTVTSYRYVHSRRLKSAAASVAVTYVAPATLGSVVIATHQRRSSQLALRVLVMLWATWITRQQIGTLARLRWDKRKKNNLSNCETS